MLDPSDAPPASEQVIENLSAADGGRLQPTANSLADFMRMIEAGQFDADVMFDLRELATMMENQIIDGAKKVKGSLTIQIEVSRDASQPFYTIAAKHKIKRPEEKRGGTVAWLTDNNLFTPNQPRQSQMFGVRDVTPRNRTTRN